MYILGIDQSCDQNKKSEPFNKNVDLSLTLSLDASWRGYHFNRGLKCT